MPILHKSKLIFDKGKDISVYDSHKLLEYPAQYKLIETFWKVNLSIISKEFEVYSYL